MPSVTFVGKHSKDKVLSVYLGKRVYVDEGDGVEPITGIVRLDPSQVSSLSKDQGVFCNIACYFIYECYDFDVEIIDYTIYERSVQLYPKSDVVPQVKNSKLQLPDEFHFPFEFKLPLGLPPSITLNPGFVYFGRPLGVSYEVSAHVGSLTAQSGAQAVKKSRVAVRFRKASYFPLLRDVKPTETGEKVYLGGSRPLILTASLDRDTYYPGQPILVSVDIKNQSSHDVHKIRISAKQVVTARIHSGEKEKYKCQVALLESARGCPIRKHTTFAHTFSITPQVMTQETYHVAQVGRLNMSDEAQLAPTTRAEESPKDRKGLQIHYYVNVHCEVSLAKDLIVKIPFFVSGGERKDDDVKVKEDDKPSSTKPQELTGDQELLLNKLVELGNPRPLALEALKKFNFNFEKAFDWLKQNKSKIEAPEPQPASEMLISFEDEQGTEEPPLDPFSAGRLQPPSGSSTFDADVTRACDAVMAARLEFVTVQAAAAQGIFAPLPQQPNEIALMISKIAFCGAKLQEFLSDVSNPNDSSVSYHSAYATASQLIILSNVVKSVASHSTNLQVQQNLLNLMHDLFEKSFHLFSTGRELQKSPSNIEVRRRVMNLADALSQSFTALRSALPGLKEIDLAVNSINFALSELGYDLPNGVEPEKLQQSLDNLNSYASQLSQAFQKLGAASTGPTDELASIAQQYRYLLPLILSNGKVILGGMLNPQARTTFLKLLQDAGSTNVQLLISSKEINASPSDAVLKSRLESRARDVVEAMKKLLMASNALQNQLKSMAPSSTSPPPQVAHAPTPQATNPAIAELQKPNMKRRDSFDDFIVNRVGSKASPTSVMDSAKSDPTLTKIEEALKELDLGLKNILAARARPRKVSSGADSSSDKPGTGSAIYDSVFSIVQSSITYASSIQERYKELCIMGQSFSSNDIAPQSKEKLIASLKLFSNAVNDLVAQSTASGSEDVTRLIVASSNASAQSATLLEACRGLSPLTSPTQQSLEAAARQTIQQLTLFVTTAMTAGSAEHTATEDVTRQLRVLQLEQGLEQQRTNALNSPRKQPRRTAYDSD